MDSMDAPLIEQALNYHGLQLQNIWEFRRSKEELATLIRRKPSFEIYEQREKTLSAEDNKKRLKLQEFLVKKADVLYNKSNLENSPVPIYKQDDYEEAYGTMPGLDSFVKLDNAQIVRNFLESLGAGDVIYAQVLGKSTIGLLLKVLCSCSDCPRIVSELNVKALILNSSTVPAVEKKGVSRDYTVNDLVCVCVSEINIEAERVIASMNTTPREGLVPHPPLGLIESNDLPEAYRRVVVNHGVSFESILTNSPGFFNPNNIKYLSDLLSLGQDNHSNMVGLREKFPPNEYAVKLREVQATKWSFYNVTEGIDHFKAGRHSEAFKCLNKALLMDPLNDEGLVARGCLFVTIGKLSKAVDDFEMAMKLNQNHISARKYLAETLVALGRNYKGEEQYDEAEEAFKRCLAIVPHHEVAKKEIEYLKMGKIEEDMKYPLTILRKEEKADSANVKQDKIIIQSKSRMRKKRKVSSSSSSSSSDSSESESTSTTSSSSDSESSSESSLHKKSDKPMMSPLSKRMAMYNILQDGHQEFVHSEYGMKDYELEVRKFLDKSKDDSDYEDKVKIFLKTAARWKKEREKEKTDENMKNKKRKRRGKRTKASEERKEKLKRKENRKKYKARKKKMKIRKRPPLTDLQSNSKFFDYYDKPVANVLNEESQSHYLKPKISSQNGSVPNDTFKTTRQRNQISPPFKKKSDQMQSPNNYKSFTSPQRKSSYNSYSSKPHVSYGAPRTPRVDNESDSEPRRYSKKYRRNKRLISRDSSEDSSFKRFVSRSRSNSRSSSSSRLRSPFRFRSRSSSDRSKKSASFERRYRRSHSRSYSRSSSKYRSRSISRSRSPSEERKYFRFNPTTRVPYPRGGRFNPRFQGHSNNYRGGGGRGGGGIGGEGPNLNFGGPNFNNGNRFHNNPNNRFMNSRRGFVHRFNNPNPNFRGRGMPPNRGGRFFHNNRGFGFNFRGRPPFPQGHFFPQEACPYPQERCSPPPERPPYAQERDTFSQELEAYSQEKRTLTLQKRSYSREKDVHSQKNRNSTQERHSNSRRNYNDKSHSPEATRYENGESLNSGSSEKNKKSSSSKKQR